MLNVGSVKKPRRLHHRTDVEHARRRAAAGRRRRAAGPRDAAAADVAREGAHGVDEPAPKLQEDGQPRDARGIPRAQSRQVLPPCVRRHARRAQNQARAGGSRRVDVPGLGAVHRRGARRRPAGRVRQRGVRGRRRRARRLRHAAPTRCRVVPGLALSRRGSLRGVFAQHLRARRAASQGHGLPHEARHRGRVLRLPARRQAPSRGPPTHGPRLVAP
mmetsp:Transcript_19516/g.77656  ORF Transcript_19516/g.77656 Transcript_19516/m.77656 type:complete len:217 (+) Transcript_19516:3-653(+)